MKMILFIAFLSVAITGCTPNKRIIDKSANNEPKLVTIKLTFNKCRSFEIMGTDIRGIKQEQLENVLKNYVTAHPLAAYECLSNCKLRAEDIKNIEKIFESAGIKLQHFWVAVNFAAKSTGPYGPGFYDAIGRKH